MRTIRMIFVTVLMMLLATMALAQESKPMEQMKEPNAKMSCEAMMQQMEGMHAKMKAMDDQIDKLVADMKAARGQARVDKIVAVIDELVGQRKQMRGSMQAMMPMMMQHMTQHMQMGMAKGMSDAMSSCPMMKEDGAPAEHEHKH